MVSVAVFDAAPWQGAVSASDWVQFRGPGGRGVSEVTGLPAQWSDGQNLVWKTELPGAGTSSPIVLGDRIYLTCYGGYGQNQEDPGNPEDLMRYVVCLNRETGDLLWRKPFEPDLPESKYRGNGARHGYSSSTPTTDGERLYVFFGKSGVYCLDLDGNHLWHSSVGDRTAGWGSSNSPVLFNDLVIINASIESQSLVALDKLTGKEVWRARDIERSWNTPVLAHLSGGAVELVVSVRDWLLAYDPQSGKELWRSEGIHDYVCPSVVAHEGVVYAIGGRRKTAVAVRAGGRGDVSETHQLWRQSVGSNVSSPVFYEGHLYWIRDRGGVAYCVNAKNGELVYEQRVRPQPGNVYSSALAADGKVYYVSQYNGVYVMAAKPEFELLAHNTFEDESRANASPTPHNGQLLLRTDKFLYCVGKK